MTGGKTFEYATSILIEATPEEVFDYLVRPERMVLWMGERALLGANPGDPFEADINGILIRGEILTLERPHRFAVSWGELGHEGFPPGFSRVTFNLHPVEGGTELELLHDRLPEDQATGYSTGWKHYLARLAVAAAGGNPGADLFSDGD